MSESFDLREPGRFTVGAIGEPGRRVFYFQAFAEGTEVALKCEKQQAQALAEHLVRLLDDLPARPEGPIVAAEALPPTDLLWAVGSISLGIDQEAHRILVMFEELLEIGEDDEIPEDPAQVRVRLTPEQVRAYAAQVDALLASSRPLCRLCEAPIDPSGHACPRLN
ncbi:DUF3090 family protein [Aquihabitans sp. McL0605]|uniref:DUF3090 family protein n=1 Tax=Aquihabitans sp. McL0605 TaxID=3415671 RepID=UPI003CFB7531